MDINSSHFQLLRNLREELRVHNWQGIESLVEAAGLETLLNPVVISSARALNAREVVILLSTIGVENSSNPLPHRRLLAAYQLMQGKIGIDEAIDACQIIASKKHYYEALFSQIYKGNKYNITIPTAKTSPEDLWFGIQILCDTHSPSQIIDLLKAWQRLEKDDKPWLTTTRLIIERADVAKGYYERKILGETLEQLIDLTPKKQQHLKDNIEATLLDKLWLPNAEGKKALMLAHSLSKRKPTIENDMLLLRSLIRSHSFNDAIILAGNLIEKSITSSLNHKDSAKDEDRAPYTNQIVDFNTEAAEVTLKTINNALRAKGLKPFLISGSLLGCMRDGKIMPHDKDLDMGLIGWESQFELAQAIIELGCFDINLKRLKGKDLFLISAIDQRTNIAIDFFMFHDRGDHYLHGIDYQYGFTQNFAFTKFNLKEVDFLGDKFYIPDNWDLMLKENYGDWEKPEPSYVVTVESPAILEPGNIRHKMIAHLEILKIINNKLNPKKIERILNADAQKNMGLIPIFLKQRLAIWVNAIQQVKF